MTLRSLVLAAASLSMIHCAAPEPELDAGAQYDAWISELSHGQAAPPIDMDWYVPPMILGETIEVTVTGGPANRTIVFVASSDTTSAGACPAAIAPECMGVPSPFAILARGTTDANGEHTFTLRVPRNLPFSEVRVQAVSMGGGAVYLTRAPRIDILPVPTDYVIYDLRTGFAADGDLVRTSGIVTATTSGGYFLQDPTESNFGGIYVFDTFASLKPAVGDAVSVVGEYTEFFGTTGTDSISQVVTNNAAYTVLSSGNPLPAPIDVQPGDWAIGSFLEAFESMTVRLSDPTGQQMTIATDLGFGEFGLTANLGGTEGVIDDTAFRYLTEIPTFSVGDTVNAVTGPMYFSFDAYKVLPTSAASFDAYVDAAP